MRICLALLLLGWFPAAALAQHQDLNAFVRSIEIGINAGNGDAIDSQMLLDTLLNRSLRSMRPKNSEERITLNSMRNGMRSKFRLGGEIAGALQGQLPWNGAYYPIRTYETGGVPHAVFGLFSVEGGINYHDFELVRLPEGYRILDCYVYATGELMSETLRGVLQQIAPAGMSSIDDPDKGAALNIAQMRSLTQAGDYEGALARFDALPPDWKRNKAIRILAMKSAIELSDTLYLRHMQEYEQMFPGDPSLPLIQIDQLLYMEQYAQVNASIDTLDARLGGDPALDMMRGFISIIEGDRERSYGYFRRLQQVRPDFLPVYPMLLNQCELDLDVQTAVSLLTQLNQRPDMGRDALEDLMASFPVLAETPEYEAWYQKAR